ncbi:MAG: hypothetical protein AAGB11_08885 [Pseudomonadota bacterium]
MTNTSTLQLKRVNVSKYYGEHVRHIYSKDEIEFLSSSNSAVRSKINFWRTREWPSEYARIQFSFISPEINEKIKPIIRKSLIYDGWENSFSTLSMEYSTISEEIPDIIIFHDGDDREWFYKSFPVFSEKMKKFTEQYTDYKSFFDFIDSYYPFSEHPFRQLTQMVALNWLILRCMLRIDNYLTDAAEILKDNLLASGDLSSSFVEKIVRDANIVEHNWSSNGETN